MIICIGFNPAAKEEWIRMKKILHNLLLVFLVILAAFAGWKIYGILNSYRTSGDSYEALEQYVSFTETAATVPETEEIPQPETQLPHEDPTLPSIEPDDTVWPRVDFEQLRQINADIVAWIYIEGTNINYPVVQGEDNSYYLNHLFDGTYNRAGCIFLDQYCASDFSDQHSIIYGHNMNDKAMFASLTGYKKQEFYDAHPIVLLLTPTRNYKIRLFSGYVSDSASSAWKRSFSGDGFARWLSEVISKSAFVSGYTPTEEDRIVTLSTCTYEFDSARFVLHGYIEKSIENQSE